MISAGNHGKRQELQLEVESPSRRHRHPKRSCQASRQANRVAPPLAQAHALSSARALPLLGQILPGHGGLGQAGMWWADSDCLRSRRGEPVGLNQSYGGAMEAEQVRGGMIQGRLLRFSC